MLRPMTDARHRWVFPDPMRLDPAFREAARAAGPRDVRRDRPRASRRRRTRRRSTRSSGPAVAGLHDPRLLPDAALVVERIARARAGGERVMVFGDFDADGLTGLAQLVLALRRLGIDADPVRAVAARGGPRPVAGRGRAAAAEGDVALIITVDTGSTSVAEVAVARERGIDVIVTDHHHLPDGAAGGDRAREPAARGLGLPGTRPVGERRRVHRRPAAARRSWRTRRPRRSTSRTWRRSGPSRTSRRSWARTARSRSSASSGCGRTRGPGSRRSSSAAPGAGPASTSRRWASSSRRGSTRPAGWGRPSMPPACCWPRRRSRRPSSPRRSRPRTRPAAT